MTDFCVYVCKTMLRKKERKFSGFFFGNCLKNIKIYLVTCHCDKVVNDIHFVFRFVLLGDIPSSFYLFWSLNMLRFCRCVLNVTKGRKTTHVSALKKAKNKIKKQKRFTRRDILLQQSVKWYTFCTIQRFIFFLPVLTCPFFFLNMLFNNVSMLTSAHQIYWYK